MNVIFLGNSHLSAFKFAYGAEPRDDGCKIDFYCAGGADLGFTELRDGIITPMAEKLLSEKQLLSFYGCERPLPHYFDGKPTKCVKQQFLTTGGREFVDVRDADAIFYVAGMSPYDFRRIGRHAINCSVSHRLDGLASLLGRDFFCASLIKAIKKDFPRCRHYLIGRPLAGIDEKWQEYTLADIRDARHCVAKCSKRFLFDDVYMPSDHVLRVDLLATRKKYFQGGRLESEVFQGRAPTREDKYHVNKSYGKIVWEEFIAPILEYKGTDY